MHLPQVLFCVVLTLLLGANACPHALGDWEKQPPEERAKAANIIVVGYVTKSYKSLADKNTNYAVEFKIIRTLKGESLIADLPAEEQIGDDVYRITNFGSMLMCFADVDEEHVFMLFLQVVDDHLSALYTDLFGAAEVWTMQMEDKVILTNTGESGCSTQLSYYEVQAGGSG